MILPDTNIVVCGDCGSLYVRQETLRRPYCDGCSKNDTVTLIDLDQLIQIARIQMDEATRDLAPPSTDPIVQILLSIEVERAMEEVPDVGEITCRLNNVGSKIATLALAMQALDGEAPKVRSRLMRRFLQLNNLRERLAMKQRRSS